MRKLAVVVAFTMLVGCHGISKEALTEVEDTALAGDYVLTNWDQVTDAQKKRAVFAFTRTCHDVRLDVLGIPVPVAYVSTDSKVQASTTGGAQR